MHLSDCKINENVKILDINAGKSAKSNLNNMGLKIGDIVFVKSKSPIKGPIVIKCKENDIAIGNGLAKKINVERLN